MEKQEHENETVKDKTKVLTPNNTWQFSKRKDEKKKNHRCHPVRLYLERQRVREMQEVCRHWNKTAEV